MVVICLVFPAGCGTGPLIGVVYTKVTMPLTKDLHETPVTARTATGNIIKIKEPVSGYGLYAEVNSNAIGEISKKHGISNVYFADQEVFSLLGIWTTKKIIIYGN